MSTESSHTYERSAAILSAMILRRSFNAHDVCHCHRTLKSLQTKVADRLKDEQIF
jgi:hypothetical protein